MFFLKGGFLPHLTLIKFIVFGYFLDIKLIYDYVNYQLLLECEIIYCEWNISLLNNNQKLWYPSLKAALACLETQSWTPETSTVADFAERELYIGRAQHDVLGSDSEKERRINKN